MCQGIIYIYLRPSQLYSIVYINTLADNSAYLDFKKILTYLPFEYLVNLDKIYVLQASFKGMAYDFVSFDYMTNFIKNKTICLSSFKELVERIRINREKIGKMLPPHIIAELT
jgi:hypothetical protein